MTAIIDRQLRSIWSVVILFMALSISVPAKAQIDITFYSHDFGSSFPHAFFTAKGMLKSGETVDTNYGFTAVSVSPAILWKSVKGKISMVKPKYVASSNPHFTVTVTDAQYSQLLTIVAKWRDRPQKSYSLGKRNCVHFAAEALQSLNIQTNPKTNNWKKPKSFMLEVMALNPSLRLGADYALKK